MPGLAELKGPAHRLGSQRVGSPARTGEETTSAEAAAVPEPKPPSEPRSEPEPPTSWLGGAGSDSALAALDSGRFVTSLPEAAAKPSASQGPAMPAPREPPDDGAEIGATAAPPAAEPDAAAPSATNDPATNDPATNDPATNDPATNDPVEPITTEDSEPTTAAGSEPAVPMPAPVPLFEPVPLIEPHSEQPRQAEPESEHGEPEQAEQSEPAQPEAEAEQEPAPFPGAAHSMPDGSPPSPEYRVKANVAVQRYYTDDSPYFARTAAQLWFRTVEDAERAGFRSAG